MLFHPRMSETEANLPGKLHGLSKPSRNRKSIWHDDFCADQFERSHFGRTQAQYINHDRQFSANFIV